MKSFGFLPLVFRLRFQNRWATMQCKEEENVLEHSAIVAYLAMTAGMFNDKLNLSYMVNHALLHDCSEAICQDVISPVKNATPEMAAAYDTIEKNAIEQMIASAPPMLRDKLRFYFTGDSSVEYETQLVKALDKYAAYLKAKREVTLGNETEFHDAYQKEKLRVEQLCEQFPELSQIDFYFWESLDLSIDALLGQIKGV